MAARRRYAPRMVLLLSVLAAVLLGYAFLAATAEPRTRARGVRALAATVAGIVVLLILVAMTSPPPASP